MSSIRRDTTEKETLQIRVYVDAYCLGCQQAEKLINELLEMQPDLNVLAVDIEQEENVPDSLFALPTWYVNAQVWMLGNPSWEQLLDLINRDEG